MILITVLLVTYLLSFYISYKAIQKEFSKGEEFNRIKPNGGDLSIAVTPVYNTVFAVMMIFKYRVNINYSKFFNIKP